MKLSTLFLQLPLAVVLVLPAFSKEVSLRANADARSINRAIEAVSSSGGGIVKLDAGTYEAGGIILKSNVTLAGEGRSATVLKHKLKGCAINIKGTEASPLHDVIVSGLKIAGEGSQLEGHSGICIADAIRGITVENVEITGMGGDAFVSSGNVFGLKVADSRMAFNRYGRGMVLTRTKYRTNAAKIENVEVWENAGGILINNAFSNVLRGVWLENNLGVYPDLEILDSFGCGIVESYIERNTAGQTLINVGDSVTTFIENNIISSSVAGPLLKVDRSSRKTNVTGNRLKGSGDVIEWQEDLDASNELMIR